MIIYSKDAVVDRAFFRDILGFASVDAGQGWLIFALPQAEAAFHPSDGNDKHELYFMCEDLKAEIEAKIKANGVQVFTLEIVASDSAAEGKVVGTCDGGTKKIVYRKN